MGEGTKRCAKCGETKLETEFRLGGVASNGKRYRASRCRPCHAEDVRTYRQEHIEECRARELAYSRAHADRKREVASAWYHSSDTNKAKAVARAKERYAADPEHKRDQAHQTRARRAGAPIVEFVRRRAVYERDNGICHVCLKPVAWDDYDMDHIIPLSRGGDHTYGNVKASHSSCNRNRPLLP